MVATQQISRAPHAGFTLFEILVAVMLVGVGLMGLIGVIMLALARSIDAQAACTAIPTAITVVHDPNPLRDPALSGPGDWTIETLSIDDLGGTVKTTKGWINGYYVVRRESGGPNDVFGERRPAGGGWSVVPGGIRSSRVQVSVYDGRINGGREVASFTTRVLRQGGP